MEGQASENADISARRADYRNWNIMLKMKICIGNRAAENAVYDPENRISEQALGRKVCRNTGGENNAFTAGKRSAEAEKYYI